MAVKQDRFGNKFQSIFCKENKNGYPQGYVELGKKLYKIEPSTETKENNKGEAGVWAKITEVKKRTEAERSM